LLLAATNYSKAKAYNTCIAPQVTYRDFRGAGRPTTQARANVQPIGCRPGPQIRASLTAKQPQAQSQPALLMVSTPVIYVITWIATHLPTPKGWGAELASWLTHSGRLTHKVDQA